MKKSSLLVMLLTVGLLLVLVGCNAEKKDAANTPAVETTTEAAPATAEHPAAEHPAAEHPGAAATEAGTEMAAAHDCAGACGMTNVPADQLTEVDGKFYCAGCAVKAKEDAAKAAAGHGNG